MNKKGQAAMEFLMTYGWAILAAIIAIGVLAYFGIFNLSAPSQATLSAPFYANAWNIDASAGTVQLEVRNNGGETLTVNSLILTISNPSARTCTVTNSSNGYVISSGDLQAITTTLDIATCGTALTLTEGTDVRADITLNYRRPGSNVDLSSTGQLSGSAAA